VPANTREKRVSVPWKEFQNNPISEEQHNKWKKDDAFLNGMAIIAGKLWHNNRKKGLFLILVDLDNQLAIDEFCTRNGIKTPLRELSQSMIIEQHQDELNKAHVIFYASHPFPKKSSDTATLGSVLEHNEIPAIEVKGLGEHGLLFVSPSPHRNGNHYQIIGTREPVVNDQLLGHLEVICAKYGIRYSASGSDASTINADALIPIKDLFKSGTKILEGHNRHEALLRVMESLLIRNQNIIDGLTIKKLAQNWNDSFCQPPLDKQEFERQWKDAVKFIHAINKQRAIEQYQYEERKKREIIELERTNSEARKNEGKNPLRIGVLVRLNEEGINHCATGQISSLGFLYKMVRSAHARCSKCGQERETIFLHPKRIQYFNDHFEPLTLCQFYFKSMHCDGMVKIEPRYVNALDVEVRDTNSLQDIDRLKCILFEDDTKNVGIGENVTIVGSIYMETAGKSGVTFPVSYIQSIKYEDREKEELTRLDIEAIKRFRKRIRDDQELISKFVSMMACNVFGHDNIKEGILYMVTNAKQDKRERRERIHGAIISEPGRAKTALLMYTTKLITRSTFETAQMSTGLSLLAIVEKNGETKMLRLGPVSYSLFACIDEFNKLTNVDQEKFFGVMQEGYFTNNKFGINQKITVATTILVSLNPPEGSRSIPDSDGKIDLTDLNIISPIWDRFDFKFYIPPMNEFEVRRLANAKAEQEEGEVPDYSRFIRRWIAYAKQYFNPRLTLEAKSILIEAYTQMNRKNRFVSPRRLETLFNATKARARFLLKNEADSTDAIAIVKFYGKMIENYESGIIEAKDVLEVATDECFRILGQTCLNQSVQYTFKELLEEACRRNPQVENYIKSGVPKKDFFDRSNNKQARVIYERLMSKHPEIQIVSKNPTTLLLAENRK